MSTSFLVKPTSSRRGRHMHDRPLSPPFKLLVLLLLVTTWRLAAGVGYMSTIAGLWGDVSAFLYTACALEVGTLYPKCWGSVEFYGDSTPPVDVSFWAISNGGYFVCGLLLDSHHPSCWGYLNDSMIPAQYQNTSYSNINSGGWHACGVRANNTDSPGTVDCWGLNSEGQALAPAEAMLSVTAGDYFSCGLLASTRHVSCWGRNISGGASALSAPNASFQSIFAGRNHMCGLELDTKKTLCWGNNTSGQAAPPKTHNFTVITGGYSFSCGLREDNHEAVCWGDNRLGQTDVPAGVRFSTISSGDWFTCGVREDDEKMHVVCWGSGHNAAAPAGLEASMGLCVKQCDKGQYELLDSVLGVSEQCPSNSNGDKVCLFDCSGGCGLSAPNSTTASPSPAPPSASSHKQHTPIRKIVIAVAIATVSAVALIGMLALCLIYRSRRLRRPAAHEDQKLWGAKASKIRAFTAEELREATQDYDSGMVVGTGSFGSVYKGILGDGQQVVAIKRASTEERASTFGMELELLSSLHHIYLVNLVGYCEAEKALVFEFMANGSLRDCLLNKRIPDWKARMKIALQAAKGLEYLHVYASPKVIHRDVKTSNILLDEAWDAHIADFGLSLYGPVGSDSHLSSLEPVGTPGYVDPDYLQTYQLTTKSDVYSFGVVLLELLSGRQAMDMDRSLPSLVTWAVELAVQGESRRILNTEELNVGPEDAAAEGLLLTVVELALECVRVTGKERPTMTQVASRLQGVVQPLFIIKHDTPPQGSSSCTSKNSIGQSELDMTIPR